MRDSREVPPIQQYVFIEILPAHISNIHRKRKAEAVFFLTVVDRARSSIGKSEHFRIESIGPTVHWSDSQLVRQSIGPTVHWSDSPLVRQIY